MFAKLHLLSQDQPEGGAGLRWRAHPYLRMAGAVPRGPAVFEWNQRQRTDLDALWRDPAAEGARERLARDLAAFCEGLGWTPDAEQLADAERHGDEYLVTVSAVPPELYILPWETIHVGASGTFLSDYRSAQVRYAVPGLEPRGVLPAPPVPGVLFAWSAAGGQVPHEAQGAAIRAAAEAGGVVFRELADVDEGKLQAALDAGPPSVLHLLCHGSAGPEGEPPHITWGAADTPSQITATRLARMVRPHSDAIRLVVLSACGSGDGHGDPLFMGSMAQELHKKGIPDVVASRYPLSVPGSQVLTRVLYDRLLRDAWSLERALRHTREALLRVGDDGESHPGDAYGIQLYASDTERFVSDNTAEAVRPVLSSYPFGTAAQPVPAKGPPRGELTLHLKSAPPLSGDRLAGALRRASEDDSLTFEARPEADGAHALIVNTTVDGVQRLLSAWRSKALRVALGVVVAELILTHGASPAMASTAPAAGQPAQAGSTGQPAASGQAAAAGQATAAAGNAIAVQLAVAVIAGAAVIGGGVAVYRAQTRPADAVGEVHPADPAVTVASPAAAVDAMPGSAAIAVPAGPAPLPASPSPADAALAIDAAGPVPPPAPPAPATPRAPSSALAPPASHVMLAPTLNPAGPVTVYRSRNYGGIGQTVAFVVPPQPGASGPEHMISSGVVQPSKLTVSARDRATGATQALTLRGFKPTACGNNQMNSAALCEDGKHESVLALTIFPADNAGVPPGTYTGHFLIEARRTRAQSGPGDPAAPGDRDGALVEMLTFDYAISIEPDAGAAAHTPPDAGAPEVDQ
jgi:hypothetical protein